MVPPYRNVNPVAVSGCSLLDEMGVGLHEMKHDDVFYAQAFLSFHCSSLFCCCFGQDQKFDLVREAISIPTGLTITRNTLLFKTS